MSAQFAFPWKCAMARQQCMFSVLHFVVRRVVSFPLLCEHVRCVAWVRGLGPALSAIAATGDS